MAGAGFPSSFKNLTVRTLNGVESVKGWGAVGDGSTDDTAAIQAAVNNQTSGGIVFFPPGVYKITSKITFKKGTRILGSGKSLARGGAIDVCVIDAATITSGTSLEWPGNACNHTMEDICLRGPGAAAVASSQIGGAVGIDTGYSGANMLMRNVLVTGFTNGILLQLFSHATLINVTTQTQRTHGICITDSQFIDALGCVFQNAGAVSGANDAANIYIGHDSSATEPSGINFYNSVTDEASSSAQSVYVKAGSDISLNNMTVFTTISGYGVRIGNGTTTPTRVSLNNVRVMPYTPGTGGTYAILISANAVDARLVNVTTDAGTGGDISDSGTTTTLINVNGASSLSGTLAITGPAITAGSGTGLTVNNAGDVRRVVHKVTVTFAALAAAGLTADKTIATLPAKTRLVGIVADTTAAYTGGGVTAASLIVGTAAGGAELIATHDVFTAPITKGLADADLGTSMVRSAAVLGGVLPSWTGTTIVSVRLTTVTANTDQLSAGSTTYHLVTEVYP